MKKKHKKKKIITDMDRVRPLTLWGIQNFPKLLRQRFMAYCKAQGHTGRDVVEYIISKHLRDAMVDIPPIQKDNKFVQELKKGA